MISEKEVTAKISKANPYFVHTSGLFSAPCPGCGELIFHNISHVANLNERGAVIFNEEAKESNQSSVHLGSCENCGTGYEISVHQNVTLAVYANPKMQQEEKPSLSKEKLTGTRKVLNELAGVLLESIDYALHKKNGSPVDAIERAIEGINNLSDKYTNQ